MGQYDTHGGYFAPQGYTRINTGGSHEENPNGGVQLGVDAQGIPNMLEEGEPVYNDFVYSDNIKADAEILKKHGIPTKFAGKLYSVIADYYVEEANKRPLDPISNNGLNAMLTRLAEAQEEQKQLETQKEIEEQLSQMSPEEQEQFLAMLEQQNAQGQMPEGVPPEATMQGAPQEAPTMMPQGQQMSPEEAMMMQQQAQASASQMMPQQPVMMAKGGLIRRFDLGSPQGTLVTHRLAGTEDLNRFYNPQAYSLSIGDTAQEQAPEVETIMATTPPVYFNPDDTGTTRGDYMAVDGNGNLTADIEPAVVTAFPGKSQAWVDAEVGPRSIKKKVSDGINDAMYDAIDIYENSLIADPFTHAVYSAVNGNYGDAVMDVGLALLPGVRTGTKAIRSAEKGVQKAAKAAERTNKIVRAREATADAKLLAQQAKTRLDASEKAISNIEREIQSNVAYRETLDDVLDKRAVTDWLDEFAGQYDEAARNAKQAKKELKAAERDVWRAERQQKLQETLHPDATKRADAVGTDIPASTASTTTGTSNAGAEQVPELSRKEKAKYYGKKAAKWAVGSTVTGAAVEGGIKGYNLIQDDKSSRTAVDADSIEPKKYALGGSINRFAPGGALTTLPRYAGIANSAIDTLYNAVQQPDHYEIPQYNPILPTMSAPEYIVPVYRPDDINMLTNQYLADAAGNRRAIMNSGAGLSTAANLVALNYGAGNNIGTARERVLSANNTQMNNVIQQRNALAKDRAATENTFAQANANILNTALFQNPQTSLRMQLLNNQEEGKKYTAFGTSKNALVAGLVGTGTENMSMNMINQNPYFDYVMGSDGSIMHFPKSNHTDAQASKPVTTNLTTFDPSSSIPKFRLPNLKSPEQFNKSLDAITKPLYPSHLSSCGGFIRPIKK